MKNQLRKSIEIHFEIDGKTLTISPKSIFLIMLLKLTVFQKHFLVLEKANK